VSDHLDESQDWPLRDYSARLRPPARGSEQADAEPDPFAAPPAQEPEPEPYAAPAEEPDHVLGPPPDSSEAEVLYDEDELDAGIPEVSESVPAEQPPLEQPPLEPLPEAPPADEHVAGDFRVPGGYQVLEGAPTGHRRSVAIVVSRFNGEITNRLLASALAELDEAGVTRDAVLVMPVPGAFELPIAAMALAKTRRYSCVVALGCVIRGETPHFDFVAAEAASGLQLAGIETGVPVSLGVLTCDTVAQAEARVERGAWAARTALEMADAFSQLRAAAAGG
jgi:6,7-dimethyl-8-ribityllumazine synthase